MNSVSAKVKIFYIIEHQKDKNAKFFCNESLILQDKFILFV